MRVLRRTGGSSSPQVGSPRGWAASALSTILFTLSCAQAPSATANLEEVEPPPDLEQLDQSVRSQFDSLWRDGSVAEEASGPGGGAAWGALGQWFDVYDYADSAGRCYRNAMRLDAQEPRWPYYLGVLAEAAGELEDADELYRRSSQLAPEALEPRVRLGELALVRQDLDLAGQLFGELRDRWPNSPGVLLGLGRLALLEGDPAAAVGPLEELLELQPEAVPVHYSLGLAWRRLGDEAKAADHLQRVPEDNLDQVTLTLDAPWMMELQALDQGARTFTRRGVRAYRRGDHEQAVVLLGRAVASDPEGPEKRLNFGMALRTTRRWQAAGEQLQRALDLSEPDSDLAARAHLELGRLFAERGRPAAAESHLARALEIDPQSIPARLELGRLYQRQGRLEEALGQYATLRSVDRPLPGARFWYAATLSLLERPGEAVRALDEDLERLGDERRLRLLLARLLSAAPDSDLRDVERARALITAAEGPVDVLYAETVAMVAAAQGRFDEAVSWQRSAVDALAGARPRTAVQTARRRLELYEHQEPCRNPWEAREAPIPRTVSRT